jgi:hypothetical protein
VAENDMFLLFFLAQPEIFKNFGGLRPSFSAQVRFGEGHPSHSHLVRAVLLSVWVKGLDFFYGPGGEGCVRRVRLLDRLQGSERSSVALPGHDVYCALADSLVVAVERFAHFG